MGLSYEGVFIETPLHGQNVQCLLGRDILSHAVFWYNGTDNSFSFCL
jgi:hypothetical protein